MKKAEFIKMMQSENASLNNCIKVFCAVGAVNAEIKNVITAHGGKVGETTNKDNAKLREYILNNVRLYAMQENTKIPAKVSVYTFVNATKVYFYTADNWTNAIYDIFFTNTPCKEINFGVYYNSAECKQAYTDNAKVENDIANDKQIKRTYNVKANVWKKTQMIADKIF